MEKIVYILGSGFSAPLGLPVMANFIEKSKDLFQNNSEKFSGFSKIYEELEKLHKIRYFLKFDIDNIEDILSFLEMEASLTGDKEIYNDFQSYLKAVVESHTPQIHSFSEGLDFAGDGIKVFPDRFSLNYSYIYALILTAARFAISGSNKPTDSKQKQKNLIKEYDYSFITLNYDRVIENLIEFHNKSFAAGETGKISVNPIKSENNHFIRYAKLHGSLETQIIPPTWNKSNNASALEHWNLAYQLLSEANHIRILGFSMPVSDSYIKYLIGTSIRKAFNLKSIEVITLDQDGSTKKRYQEMFSGFRGFKFMAAEISGYLHELCRDRNGSISFSKSQNEVEDSHKRFSERFS